MNVLDDNQATIWHSSWNGAERKDLWLQLELPEAQKVNGVRLQTRNSYANGFITKYRIETSMNGTNFTEAVSGEWDTIPGWKKASFEEREAKFVRIYAVESYSNGSNNYASAAEMRLTQEKADIPALDKALLEGKLAEAKELKTEGYTTSSVNVLNKAIEKAEKVLVEAKEQSELNAMVEELKNAMKLEEKADAEDSRTEFDKIIADVKEESVYTEDSWTAYAKAKEEVEKALKDTSDVSEAKMKELLADLKSAVAGLKEAETGEPQQPEKPENPEIPQQKPQKPQQKPDNTVPETGDTTNGLGFMLLAVMAGGYIVFAETKKRRNADK